MALNNFIKTVKTIFSSEETPQKVLEQELNKEINQFIHEKNEKALTFFINNGYRLNENQSLKIIKNYYYFDTHEISNHIEVFHTENLKEKILVNLNKISSLNFSFNKKANANQFYEYTKENREIYDFWITRENKTEFLDDEHNLKVLKILNELIPKIKKKLKHINYTYLKTSIAEEFIEVGLENLKLNVKKIELINSNFFNDFLENKLLKYSEIFDNSKNLKDCITEGIIKNINLFHEKDLPPDALNIIADIRDFYKSIDKSKTSIEQKLEVDNLFKTRLPQVLQEYITISPRYKEKLIGHNERPDDLLIESLSKIKNGIEEIFDNLQSQSHNRMKVTHKYLISKP